MKIAIDGNEANVHQEVGVSVYAKQLLTYFAKVANKTTSFVVYLQKKPLPSLPKENPYFSYKVVPGPFLWSQVFLPLHFLADRSFDLFFAPAHYIPRYCPSPVVVTIHDLSYIYFQNEFLKEDLYKLKNWTERAVNQSQKIIAVSNNTKRDIITTYKIPSDKIHVVYNGFELQTKQEKRYPVDSQFILYTGTIQPRKNIITLLESFASFVQKFPDFKLVLAGKKGWLYEKTLDTIKKLHLENKVIVAGYVSESELVYLYQHAFCFVMPSLYEGFGIPVLEAMSYGCPVISSSSSSLPEIAGDAALYFDPKNPTELYNKMVELKQNESVRKNLIKKGRNQVAKYSWEKTAKETLEVLTHTNG